jgi:hypothetical protein
MYHRLAKREIILSEQDVHSEVAHDDRQLVVPEPVQDCQTSRELIRPKRVPTTEVEPRTSMRQTKFYERSTLNSVPCCSAIPASLLS